jgi:hypothetical protein
VSRASAGDGGGSWMNRVVLEQRGYFACTNIPQIFA